MSPGGEVLGPKLRTLVQGLAELYLNGDLVIVAGAGVSRASGLPGWDEMVAVLQKAAADDLSDKVDADELEAVLASLHRTDPISRADSLQRLLKTPRFHKYLHSALYDGTTGEPFRPSVIHWHIAALVDRHADLRFLELGRSCVLPRYRNKRTVELLWHGIWSYVRQHRLDVMIGCASFEGTDPDRLALPLSFLHHYARAPEAWRAAAHPSRRVEMKRMAREAINPKAALHELPPLIKGYLRLGAFIGDGAVIDHQFGTTDVLIVMPVSAINARYIEHFGADASRHAA